MQTSEKTLQRARYRIIHQLEKAERGTCYQAFDNFLNLNVVLQEIAADFSDEAERLTKIEHENLLSVYHYFSEGDRNYLAIELAGDSLIEAIKKNQKPFSFLEAGKWADQLLDALGYLHKHAPPIIHRRIAPQNVFPSHGGKIKLLFSGDNKLLDVVPHGKTADADAETHSLNYLPLEQLWENLDPASQKVILNSYDERAVSILERPSDARSDLYALGATLYFMITGQHPADALARSIDILEGKADSLTAPHLLNSSIPLEVSSVLMRAMEIRRENRFDSAIIMRQILRTAFVKTSAVETKEKKPPAQEMPASETKSNDQEILAQERRLIEENRLKIEAEQKSLAAEREIIQQSKLEFEAARKRQTEAAEEQLRQAEIKRRRAELRAAEAERKLSEKQIRFAADDNLFELDDTELLDLSSGQSQTPASAFTAQTPAPEISSTPEKSAVLPPDLFTVAEPKSRAFRYVAAVFLLLITGGAGWGIWANLKPKPAIETETVQTQQSTSSEKPISQTPLEPAPAPSAESLPESVSLDSSTENAQTTVAAPAPRNRITPAAQPRRQILPSSRPAASQKKEVTVDDLINDN